MVSLDFESALAAACSDASYEYKPVAGCRLIWEHHQGSDSVGIYAYQDQPDWLVLTFRGSEELRDWSRNFRAFPRHQGEIHGGYARCWAGLSHAVEEKLAGLSFTHLTITGHSMGGAVATLAAWQLPWACHLITFGSPRVVNHSLAERIQEKVPVVRRFVHGGDVVPLYPVLLHRHVGEVRRIGAERTLVRMLLKGFADHHPKRYAELLATSLKTTGWGSNPD
ncbi:lipase family protein [Synechococcus sp. SYN20]|uniref:lipase family protein n=1 Tax=Synechococcus sp. SYN20 TaxID=1050714 RepID=UPI00164681A4|nr:lipase family protein [Synechococcus sp. SYN20]QNJ25980.1 lipase family protein [Synechococcus sp. SYN20]